MADFFNALSSDHIAFIRQQHLFFVGTATETGRVNVSPKGMDTLRVIDESTVLWLNLTGSGNETAAHIRESNRMTLMFCSFDRQPLILRLYGTADVIHAGEDSWAECAGEFPAQTGTRQFFRLHVDSVQTSCGYAVPLYDLKAERPTLAKWADNKGQDGIRDYWEERNQVSIDGLPTGVPVD